MFNTPVEFEWKGDLMNPKNTKVIAKTLINGDFAVEVFFSPLVIGHDATVMGFLCEKIQASHDMALKIVNATVQAFVQYFDRINQPKYIIYSVDTPSMMKVYRRLHEVYTTKNINYTDITWDDLPADLRNTVNAPNMLHMVSKKS